MIKVLSISSNVKRACKAACADAKQSAQSAYSYTRFRGYWIISDDIGMGDMECNFTQSQMERLASDFPAGKISIDVSFAGSDDSSWDEYEPYAGTAQVVIIRDGVILDCPEAFDEFGERLEY